MIIRSGARLAALFVPLFLTARGLLAHGTRARAQDPNHSHEQSDTYFALAQVLHASGHDAEAHDAANQSRRLAQSKGHVVYAERALALLAELEPPRVVGMRVVADAA